MDTIQAIQSRRSIRKFQPTPVPRQALCQMVDSARLAPQGANLQPLTYVAVDDATLVSQINTMVRWAAYIAPDGNPGPGEQPMAYVVLCINTAIKEHCDVDAGAAGATLLLAAQSLGLGTCWLGNIDREAIFSLLSLREGTKIHSVIAVGYPAETPVCEEETGSIRYYKDESGVLHVPKRSLRSVLRCNKGDAVQ